MLNFMIFNLKLAKKQSRNFANAEFWQKGIDKKAKFV